jgi:hypothetical protein
MRWSIILECGGGDGKRCTITLGTIERLAGSTTAENLGVNLQESKQIVNRLQDTVIKQQLQEHSEQRRNVYSVVGCGRLKTTVADAWVGTDVCQVQARESEAASEWHQDTGRFSGYSSTSEDIMRWYLVLV